MQKRSRILSLLILVIATAAFANKPPVAGAFGLNTHFSHPDGDIYKLRVELPVIAQMGCKWVRIDLPWVYQERTKGVLDFKLTDEMFDLLDKYKLNTSILLIGSANSLPKWVRPLSKHLPEMEEYIRTVVTRYKGRVKCWEISNEEDGGGPDVTLVETGGGRQDIYMEIAKRVSKIIREIDPEATVIMGGLTSTGDDITPYGYLENMFKNGLADCCDVINIHPYVQDFLPEDILQPSFQNLRNLQRKYHAEHMQVWGSEIGELLGTLTDWKAFFAAAFKEAGIVPEKTTLALVHDPEWNFYSEGVFANRTVLPEGFKACKTITLSGIKGLPRNCVLLWNQTYGFPVQYIADVRDFLKRGGCIIFPKSFPMYFETVKNEFGYPIRGKQINDELLPELHVAWDAYWTNKQDVPYELKNIQGPGFNALSKLIGRVCSTRNLKGNDTFVPLVTCDGKNGKRLALAGVYKLDSDLKGTVIMNTAWGMAIRTLTHENAAALLAREVLLLRALGENKTFIYKFRLFDFQPDFSWGIYNHELKPLPAALGQMTIMNVFPDGTKFEIVRNKTPWILKGTRPDGKIAWAIWTPVVPWNGRLAITGKIENARDLYGMRIRVLPEQATATTLPMFIIGPSSIEVED